jgi:Tfp pilus assembly protein PilF
MRRRAAPLLLGALLAAAPAAAQAPANGALATLLSQAEFWLGQNRPDQALRALERVLAAEPDNPDALARAARAHAALGDRATAERLLARLRQVSPGDARLPAAEEALRSAVIDPAGLAEARALAQGGRTAEAVARYRQLFGNAPPPDALAAEFYLNLAGTPAGWPEARDGLARLAQRQPNDARAQLAFAQVLTYREPTRLEGIQRLARLAGGAQAAAATAAWRQALLWLGPVPAAIPELEAFLRRNPNDGAVAAALEAARNPPRDAPGEARQQGFAQLGAGQLRDAAARFEAALAANPNDADALGGLGLVRLREGRASEARDLLQRAVAAAPDRAQQWRQALDGAAYTAELAEGRALLRRGEAEAAEAVLRQAVRREVPDRADAEALLGDIALSRGDGAAAEQRYRAALARRPDFGAARQGLVRALQRQGRIAEAEALLRRDAEAGRTPAERRAAQLRAEAERADPVNAVALLRAALAELPGDPWIRLDLARRLRAAGSEAEARAVMQGAGGGAESLFAAALFAEEDNRPQDAALLLQRIPAGARTPDMARLAARVQVAGDVRAAVLIGRAGQRIEARERLFALAARQDPSGATGAAVVRGFADLGDRAGAAEAARIALAASRTPTAGTRLALAGALLEAGLEAEAQAAVIALDADPGLTPEQRRQAQSLSAGLAIRAADRLNEQGRRGEAYDRLSPVLAASPGDPAANLALARLFAGADRPAEARGIAEQVLLRDPRNLEARSAAVDAALRSGDRAGAATLVAAGQSLAPGDPRVLLMEARVARAEGDQRRALAALERAEAARRAQLGLDRVQLAGTPAAVGNPFRRAAGDVAPAVPRDPLSAEIARELAAVRDVAVPQLLVMPLLRSRSGEGGLSELAEISALIEQTVPAFGGRLALRAVPVTVTSGDISADNATLVRYGTNPLLGTGPYRVPDDGTAAGIAFAIGYDRPNFSVELGTTPLGFRVQNIVGRIEAAPLIGEGLRLRLIGERAAVTNSLLSWAGQRDPLTGQVWGGVVSTGGRARLEWTRGPVTIYGGGDYSVQTGDNVADNFRWGANAGISVALLREAEEEVRMGLDATYFGYDRNLYFFTFGQGGYFSPQSYVGMSVPVDWRGRSGDFAWRLGGSLGFATWNESSSPVFPTSSAYQSQLQAAAYANPLLVAT